MDYSKEISKLIVELSEKIGKPLTSDDFYIQYQSLGHKPMPLPKDKIAVYTFVYMGQFLKIGQANSKSKARYQSHHYYIKGGKSTLANSLLKDKTMSTIVDSNNITQWIKCIYYRIKKQYHQPMDLVHLLSHLQQELQSQPIMQEQ